MMRETRAKKFLKTIEFCLNLENFVLVYLLEKLDSQNSGSEDEASKIQI